MEIWNLFRQFVRKIRKNISITLFCGLGIAFFVVNSLQASEQIASEQINTHTDLVNTHDLVIQDNTDVKTKTQFYFFPNFYIQAGVGVGQASKISQITNLTTTAFPTFMLALGVQQPFHFAYVHTGLKIQIAYEIGLKAFGENTEAFRSPSVFIQAYVGCATGGCKYFLPYVGIGYELLSVANVFLPSKNDTILYTKHGISYSCGVVFPITKNHAIDATLRFSKTYQFAPRFLLAYELRF